MNISLARDIEPLSEFRKKSAEFMQRLKSEKRPIILTQHGKSAAILFDVNEFEKMMNKMELMESLLKAEEQIANGEVVPHEEAKQRILANLDKWK